MWCVQGTQTEALERQPSIAPFKARKEDGYYVYVAGVVDICCLVLFIICYVAVVAAVVVTRIYSGRALQLYAKQHRVQASINTEPSDHLPAGSDIFWLLTPWASSVDENHHGAIIGTSTPGTLDPLTASFSGVA